MIDTKKLRCTIGWLGMSLSIIVLALALIYGYGFPDSISLTYYFEPCIAPFMMILGAAGVQLYSYVGYDKHDDIICTLAGIFGFGICLFPCGTAPRLDADLMVGTFQLYHDISGWIHNICAIAFFGLLAYNSLFLFTKTTGEMTANKKKRNIIFRVCGIGMIASFLVLIPVNIFKVWGGTWAVEMVALIFFGVSWLTKADRYKVLFADPKPKN